MKGTDALDLMVDILPCINVSSVSHYRGEILINLFKDRYSLRLGVLAVVGFILIKVGVQLRTESTDRDGGRNAFCVRLQKI